MSARMPFESGLLSGIMALILLVLFVGICLWRTVVAKVVLAERD